MTKPIETAAPETTRRPNIRLDDAGSATLKRAITLKLAMLGEIGGDGPELHGRALAAIVGEWLTTITELLREQR